MYFHIIKGNHTFRFQGTTETWTQVSLSPKSFCSALKEDSIQYYCSSRPLSIQLSALTDNPSSPHILLRDLSRGVGGRGRSNCPSSHIILVPGAPSLRSLQRIIVATLTISVFDRAKRLSSSKSQMVFGLPPISPQIREE